MKKNTYKNGLVFEQPAERILFEAGLKSVWRPSNIPVGNIDRYRRELEKEGYAVVCPEYRYQFDERASSREADSGDNSLAYLFVSRDPRLAREAAELDRIEKHASFGAERADATKRIGCLLGYPECCSETTAHFPDMPDQTAHLLRPYFNTFGTPNYLLNKFRGIQLISHSPCSYDCGKSCELAQIVFDTIRSREPEIADETERTKKHPLLFWDLNTWIELDGISDGREAEYSKVVDWNVEGTQKRRNCFKQLLATLSEGNRIIIEGNHLSIYNGNNLLEDVMPERFLFFTPFLLHWAGEPTGRSFRPSVLILDVDYIDGSEYFSKIDIMLNAGDLAHYGLPFEVLPIRTNIVGEWNQEEIAKVIQTIDLNKHNILIHDKALPMAIKETIEKRNVKPIFICREENNNIKQAGHVVKASDRNGLLWLIREISKLEVQNGTDIFLKHENNTNVIGDQPLSAGERLRMIYDNYRPLFYSSDKRINLIANSGCPYKKDATDCEYYSGIDLDKKGVLRKGCSFCVGKTACNAIPFDELVELILLQIRYIAKHGCSVDELMVDDAMSFTFMDKLMDAIAKEHYSQYTFLFRGRAELLPANEDVLRRSITIARNAGHIISVLLLGFENFSDKELELYNKGVKSDDIRRAIDLLFLLEKEYPENFTFTKYASHCFILFNPWTTMEDLKINIQAFQEYEIERVVGNITSRRLRLYKELPLYEKAMADDLICDETVFDEMFMKKSGYLHPEQPWRFREPDVETVWRLNSFLSVEYKNINRIRLLKYVYEYVDKLPMEERKWNQQHISGFIERNRTFIEYDKENDENMRADINTERRGPFGGVLTKSDDRFVRYILGPIIDEPEMVYPWALADVEFEQNIAVHIRFHNSYNNDVFTIRLFRLDATKESYALSRTFNINYENAYKDKQMTPDEANLLSCVVAIIKTCDTGSMSFDYLNKMSEP